MQNTYVYTCGRSFSCLCTFEYECQFFYKKWLARARASKHLRQFFFFLKCSMWIMLLDFTYIHLVSLNHLLKGVISLFGERLPHTILMYFLQQYEKSLLLEQLAPTHPQFIETKRAMRSIFLLRTFVAQLDSKSEFSQLSCMR